MIVRTTLEQRGPITDEERALLEKAKSIPIAFDEDSPELTEEELKGFRRVNEANRLERKKRAVMLRLSPQTVKKAERLEKGYM